MLGFNSFETLKVDIDYILDQFLGFLFLTCQGVFLFFSLIYITLKYQEKHV